MSNNYKKSGKGNRYEEQKSFNVFLIPIIIVIALLPLIMKLKVYNPRMNSYSWFKDSEKQVDFFLYYKHWLLVVVAAVMAAIFLNYLHKNRYKNPFCFNKAFIPLGVYALFFTLSAIFSKHAYFSFHGSIDQFETVFALLSYCIIVLYTYHFVRTEEDIRVIVKYLIISILIMILIGISQFIGHDFFATGFGTRLITANKMGKGDLAFAFEKNRVYITLFNPNYVGVYIAMVAPIILMLLLFARKLSSILILLGVFLGMIICLIGSRSSSGVIALSVAAVAILLLMRRYLFKKLYLTIPTIILVFAFASIINAQSGGIMANKIKEGLRFNKDEAKNITSIETDREQVAFTYKGNKIRFSYTLKDTKSEFIYIVTDENGLSLAYDYDEALGYYIIKDDRFSDFAFVGAYLGDVAGISISVDGTAWLFSNQVKDGTYHLYNNKHKWDKIYQHPNTFLNGYESIASSRGYLWSRSLPLFSRYLILGSGPDTFTMAFPQNDYLGFYNHSYGAQLITKPHNMYMQIAIQTGGISLIAFIVFYLMYFISSIRLYYKGLFNSYYAQFGAAIMVGTSAYLIAGIANDSSITTAPVFWVLMGIGLVVNKKAKPLIQEECARIKEEKQQRVQKFASPDS